MKDLRMAILAATGTARKRVIPAVREQDLCTIVAIHGRDQHKLAALASENSIPSYFVDAERMLDQMNPDFVFIGSPPALHQEHIRMCAERNIPVLCEKHRDISFGTHSDVFLMQGRRRPNKNKVRVHLIEHSLCVDKIAWY